MIRVCCSLSESEQVETPNCKIPDIKALCFSTPWISVHWLHGWEVFHLAAVCLREMSEWSAFLREVGEGGVGIAQ